MYELNNTHSTAFIALSDEEAKQMKQLRGFMPKYSDVIKKACEDVGIDRFVFRISNPYKDKRKYGIFYAHSKKNDTKNIIAALLNNIVVPDELYMTFFKKLSECTLTKPLMQYQNDYDAEHDQGKGIGTLYIMPMNLEQASELTQMTATLNKNYMDGLSQRAQAIGYFREYMSLGETADGEFMYMLYIESKHRLWQLKLLMYPYTDFTQWWGPKYDTLMGKELKTPRGIFFPIGTQKASNMLISWSKAFKNR